ncbi:PhnD/SsuA/transferrin family substrate-binding protein [Tianweitania sediminis]|uniref:PhnD/SsuA/transferrin family substrate-binding protein n=1 Tax=Tianweitania sediminis TaxID=1502156 RepID=A0A8J7ULB7_9HYPH|nr:PhnD/SsuA/transferrin family substrate-binding protein [Tianweitania sediminis]MBP0440775.1 PhnD/SsuA/transferrin family substrate-binding protein [Tianweitania sediminis]
MSAFIAALPMYDWPEVAADTDAVWQQLHHHLSDAGIDAPARLVRTNRDLPGVPGGIRDASGQLLAPDPATLRADDLNLHSLWHHPQLLLAQTCWGPMSQGLQDRVLVVGQPDYSDVEGGAGPLYSSAVLMRRGEHPPVAAPEGGEAIIPLNALRGRRLAFNSADSMSGQLALEQDLASVGQDLSIFSDRLETGGHRFSMRAVAGGQADICACDCRSWALMQRLEPNTAEQLAVVGWTARRKGLPFITALAHAHLLPTLREALKGAGL